MTLPVHRIVSSFSDFIFYLIFQTEKLFCPCEGVDISPMNYRPDEGLATLFVSQIRAANIALYRTVVHRVFCLVPPSFFQEGSNTLFGRND
jgi:hypothetical protein